jgi:hypothetical protein
MTHRLPPAPRRPAGLYLYLAICDQKQTLLAMVKRIAGKNQKQIWD